MSVVRDGLRKRVLFHLPVLAAVLVLPLLVAAIVYHDRMSGTLDSLRQQHDRKLGLALSIVHSRLGDMRHTLRLLAHDRQLAEALSQEPIDRARAEAVMVSFNNAVEDLIQLRWLDPTGQEQVRVDVANRVAYPVPEHQLQDKSQRYYFQAGIQTPPDRIYFSPIDLNEEWGRVVVPLQPTVRVSLQTGQDGRMPPGLLILNYNLASMLAALRQLNDDQVQLRLANPDGYWMLHPDPAQEWGQQLNHPEATLARTRPALWQALQTHEVLTDLFDTGVVSAQSLRLRPETGQVDAYLLAHTPRSLIQGYRSRALMQASLVAAILLAVGGVVLWREYRQQRTMLQLNRQLAQDKVALEQAGQRQQELLGQQQLLQQDLVQASKLSSLGMMVAGVAHELNTPIGGAMLAAARQQQNLDSLRQGFEQGLSRADFKAYLEDTEQGIELIRQNLTRCAELVHSFKRLAVDRGNEDIVEFSPRQVAEDLIHSLKPQLKQHSVTIDNRIDPTLTLQGYPGVLSQVLQNLLVNALEHGFQAAEPGTITLTARPEGRRLLITVEDNGRGIDPGIRPRLFDPFVTSRRGQGNTGLGLHFVHQWVTQVLQGSLDVQSPCDHDRGTRFTLRLPVALDKVDV